jgi:type I restriction enzyme S subunit
LRIHPIFGTPLPADWSILTIDQIKAQEPHSCVAGPFGSDISSKFFTETGIPIIRGNNLRDDLTRFIPEGFAFVSPERAVKYKGQHVKAGDLVFTCWGTIGQIGIIPPNGPFDTYIISNKQLKLRANPEIAHPLFLFYQLGNPAAIEYIRNRAIGAAIPGINLGILKSIPVALPRRAIQDRITAALAAYDDLIENNSRRIAILEEMARSLYREWFVERSRNANWRVLALGRLAEEIRDPVDPRAIDPSTPYFGLEHLPRRSIALNSWGTAGEVQSSKIRASQGDILFGKIRPYFHKVGVCPVDSVCSSDIIVLRPKHPEHFGIVLTCVASDLFVAHATQTSQGTKMPRASWQILKEYPVVIPPAGTNDTFNAFILHLTGLIRQLGLKNINLRATRDLLLPKLISGELDVSRLPAPPAA